MSGFSCAVALVFDNEVGTSIEICGWFVLFLLACWQAGSFIYFYVKKVIQNKDSDSSKNRLKRNSSIGKKMFHGLLIFVVIWICITLVVYLTAKIVQIHVSSPNESINYDEKCNGGMNYLEKVHIILKVFWSLFLYMSYWLVVATYYLRLLVIFENSMYTISKCTKIVFMILNILGAISSLLTLVLYDYDNFERGASGIYERALYTLYCVYFLETIYLSIVLRKQFLLLIRMIENNTNDGMNAIGFYKFLKRLLILAYFSFVFTLILFVAIILVQINILAYSVVIYITIIDLNISIACIAFQFAFNDKWYYLFCGKFEKFKVFSADIIQKQRSQEPSQVTETEIV